MMASELAKRDDVAVEDRWDVEAIYASEDLWQQDLAASTGYREAVAGYQDRLGESPVVLGEALTAWMAAMRQIEKVYVYAHLRNDEDLGNTTYQTMLDQARSAYVQLSTVSAYFAPEVLAIDPEVMASWMDHEALEPYRFWLDDLLRSRPHVLTPAEERLMSMVAEPLSAIQRSFGVLKNVDLAARLPSIEGDDGQQEALSHASFIKFLESRDRDTRKRAFDAYYAEYQGNVQTIASVLDGQIKTDVFRARARSYPSALEAALFDDKVDVSVYESLISAVHDALPAFFRYVEMRKKLLGADALHLYDAYVPVVPEVDLHYTYDEAQELVCAALAPLGHDYVNTLRQGLENRWVDRYENAGKRSGAYSSGCYDTMPYVLLNFTGTLDSVFTLAHELGHSMHSWLSNHNQPYHLADYRILVAEVASTTNEALLNHHLLSITEDKATRAYLIDRYLDSFRGTLFRQTMFAEFEKLIHDQVETGQPLTAESLSDTYYGLVKTYFGPTMAFDEQDEAIGLEWSRVDHFFYNFYVYKYATGMSSAIALARAILQEGQPALERYLAFLKSGGSDYPLDLLKKAGVDLTTPVPVGQALQEFAKMVDEFEVLVG